MNPFNLFAPVYDPFMKAFGLYHPEIVLEHLKPRPGDRILDLAGGTGFVAHKIAEQGARVTVVDLSPAMLRRAKSYPGLEVCRANALGMPFPSNTFDAVICMEAFHHIKKFDGLLQEVERVLKVGGTLLVSEIDLGSPWGKVAGFFEKVLAASKFISPDELLARAKKYGLDGQIHRISSMEYLMVARKVLDYMPVP